MRVVVARTRYVGIVLLTVVGLAATPPLASAGPVAGRVVLGPGELVVADQDAGEVLRIPAEGPPEVLLSGLGAVRGVVVLADGAVLAADSEAGTIVAIGGRYGEEPVEVASGLASPEALAIANAKKVYVTSFSEGTLSRVDLGTGQIEALTAGLDGPSAVLALREPRKPSHVLVAEWFSGSVVTVDRNGDRSGRFVGGLDRPSGLAMGPDGTVYVADREGDTVVAVDRAGREQPVADLDAPSGVSLDPATPAEGQDFDLLVTTASGVVSVDPGTGDVTEVAALESAVGVATAPDEFFDSGTPAPDGVEEGAGGSTGGDQASSDGGFDGDPVTLGLIALAVVLAAVAVVTGVQILRDRGDDDRDDGDEGVDEDVDEAEDSEGEDEVTVSRRERRQMRRADKSMRNAERKAARATLKAEKRSARTAAKSDPKPAAPDDDPVAITSTGIEPGPPADWPVVPSPDVPPLPPLFAMPGRGASDPPPMVASGVESESDLVAPLGNSGAPPDLARLPLFVPPTPPPLTAGPFLESLFADGTAREQSAGHAPVVGQDEPDVLSDARSADGFMSPAPPAETARSDDPAMHLPVDALPDLVARAVHEPHGLWGRRRAKRRRKEADRRHRHLRALDQLTNVMLAPVPGPGAEGSPSHGPLPATPWSVSGGAAGASPNGASENLTPRQRQN